MAQGKAELARQLFSLIMGMGIGGSTRGGVAISFVPSIVPGMPSGAASFMAKQYPTEFAPQPYHTYDVVNIPGKANFNQHGKANADVIEEAGRMQTLDEHNKAIMQFVKPGMDPKTLRAALHEGLEKEKNLAAFWNESKSRRPFSVSSSAVTGIRLTPDGRIEVKWRGKPSKNNPSGWYTFRQFGNTQEASLAAQKLLQADSIGRAVYPVISRKVKNASPGLGYWNRENYAEGYA